MNRTPAMMRLRGVMQALSENGRKPVTSIMVFQAYGLEDAAGRDIVRRQIHALHRHGELTRESPGCWRYNAQAAPARDGEHYAKIWRAVLASKPGWSLSDLIQITGVTYTPVMRYVRWLTSEGYVERHGKSGKTQHFRTTGLARERTAIPFPPLAIADPFESEKRAALLIVRAFLEANPYQTAVRRKIVAQARVILERFEKPGDADDDYDGGSMPEPETKKEDSDAQ